ncbi:MAG: hypothetical protein ACYC96_02565 [Fimbriimonadaceae bacterium]
MIVSGLLLLVALHGGQGAPSSGKLIGATVHVNGAPVVRLRWVMDEGWIPNGGYNLYRSDGTTTLKLNSAPLRVKDQQGLNDKVYQLAAQPVRLNVGQSFLLPIKATRVSSAPAFSAMRTAVKGITGAAGGPGTESQIRNAVSKTAAVVAYMAALPKRPTQPTKPVYTNVQKVAMARSHLAVTAMTLPGAAETLGMGFDDTKVTLNAPYTYTLKAIIDGVENPIATFKITVGKDPLPPAPLVEEPVQTGVQAMSLHLEIPQGVDEASFGMLYYKVLRTDATHPAGVVLANGHIVPTYQTTSGGVEVASLVSYLDSGVAIGNVSYGVQLFDSFGRSNASPVAVTAVVKDIAPPAPVTGATATYQAPKGGGGQFVIVHFAPSKGDATASKPNPADVSYLYLRKVADDPSAAWTAVTPTPVALAYAQESRLTVREMGALYPQMLTAERVAAQRSLTKATPRLRATIASRIVAVGQMKFTAFKASNAGLIAVNAFPVGEFADTSVQPDHYYEYRIVPVLKRNGVAGDMGATSPVGVPALAKAAAPSSVNLVDAIAPMSLAFKGSATNVLKLQPSHGIYAPGSLVASAGSLANGLKMAQTMVNTRVASSRAFTGLRVVGHPVAANFGRMVTVSWTPPAYSSALSFKVYRANGTGFTSNLKATLPPADTLKGSAEGQAARFQVGRKVPVRTVIQNPRVIAAGLPKTSQRPVLAGLGIYRPISSLLAFSFDTPPPLAAYSLLGQTKPGESQFIDLIPRSQANVFYYYIVPVNRWGMVGASSAPAKVKTLPSLPPSVPAMMSASPTESQTVSVGVEPNVTPEDVVEYRLYRMAFPMVATRVAVGASSGTLVAGRLLGLGKVQAGATQVSKTFGSRVLMAKGVGIAGGAKFGILQTESPAVSLSAYQGLVATSVRRKLPRPALPVELLPVFILSNYQQVASAKVDPANTSPVAVEDKTAVPGVEYVYRIVAVDSAGLLSEPSTVMDAMAIKLWCDPPTISGQATYAAATNTVSMTLAPPLSGCQAFVIERAIDAAATKFIQIKMLAANGPTPVVFTDSAVRPGQTYTYHVTAIDSAGNSSIRNGAVNVPTGVITVQVKT